jgi:hypothetical protein
MDDFENMFEGSSELNYNDDGDFQTVSELIHYLASNMNMIVAFGRGRTSLLEKIEFYIKTPHQGGGEDDDDRGGGPVDPKPLPPSRPVEFELEA